MFSDKLVANTWWVKVFREHFVENKTSIVLHLCEYLNTEILLIKQTKGKIQEYIERGIIYDEQNFDFTALEMSLFKNTLLERTNSSTGDTNVEYNFAYNLFKAAIYAPKDGDIYVDICFDIISTGQSKTYTKRDPFEWSYQIEVLNFLSD